MATKKKADKTERRPARRQPKTVQAKFAPNTFRTVKIGVPLNIGKQYPAGVLFETAEPRIVHAVIEKIDGTIFDSKWQALETIVGADGEKIKKPIYSTQLWSIDIKRIVECDAEAIHAFYPKLPNNEV